MKQVNYKINVTTDGAQKNVKGLNQDLSSTDKEVKSVNKSGKGLGDTFSKLGISMKSLATGAVVAGVGAIVGVFTSAIKKGAEFAKQMSTLEAVSGATQEEMTALSNSAKELGASTQFTAVQVGELQTEFAKMGFTTKQILASTKATLDLAASMEVDLASAATLAGSTVNAFGLQAEDTQRVVDVLAKSTSSSALDFGSLTESLKVAAPIAKATGRTIEETAAMLGVLANTGIKGSVAGTGLSKIFIELNKKGIELKDALDTVSKSSDGLNTAIDLVGVVGAKSLLNLASKSKDIDTLTESFENSAGAAAAMAEVRLDNLAGDTTKLGSAWEGFLLSIEDGEGIFNSITRGLVQAGTAMLGLLTPSISLSEEFFQQKAAVEALDEKINPLVDRYDELAAKSILTKDEQKELDTIILQVASDVPLAVTEFDEYGKALGINTEAAREFISEQKNILKLKNKAAIEDETEAIEDLNFKLKTQALQLEKVDGAYIKRSVSFTKLGKEIVSITKLNNEEVLSIKNKRTELQTEIRTRQAIIAQLKGEKTEAEKAKEAAEEAASANEVLNKSLIATQEELLEQAKKLPETTERELIVKNRKIATINKEIKRLKALGVETKKVNKDKEKEAKKELERLRKLAEERRKLEQKRLREEEKVADFLQRQKNTAFENELLTLMQQYDKRFELARDNAELEKQLTEQQALDIIALKEKYAKEEEKIEKDKVEIAEATEEQKIDGVRNTLTTIANLAQLFAGESEEQQKKAFKVQKAVNTAQALIDTYASATAAFKSLAGIPAIGPALGAAAAAAAVTAGLLNVKQIQAQQFQGGLGGSAQTPNFSAGITSQAPDFNVVGQSGFNQVAAALGEQNNTPIQAYVVSGNVTTAQALENNIIETATF
jgi:hypothetical protein